MSREVYVIIVLAIVLTALIVAGAEPDDIARALDNGLGGHRLPATTTPEGLSQQ